MKKSAVNTGKTVLQNEADRLTRIKADASRPVGCGPAIVDVAPGRGPVRRFHPRETVITPAGKIRVHRSGHDGYDALQVADAFDVMQLQSSRRKPDADPLFTVGQVAAGREYAALYERCASAGVRCSSVEALGGGGQGSFIDAVMHDSARLRWFKHAIGAIVVLSPRNAAAQADRGRRILRSSDIVHAVCVSGRTITQLLQSSGWSRSPAYVSQTRDGLRLALDRMQGYRDRL